MFAKSSVKIEDHSNGVKVKSKHFKDRRPFTWLATSLTVTKVTRAAL